MTAITKDNAFTIAGLTPKKPSEMRHIGTFMTLYGQGGSGKTTLVADVKKLGRTIHLDAEGGTDVIADIGDDDYIIVEIHTWSEFEKVIQALKRDTQDFVNVVIDNMCEIIDLWLMQHIGLKQVQIQEWGQMTREVLHMVRDLREITRVRGINVILLAWDEDTKDGAIIKKDLAFTPALRKEYAGINTIVGHVKVENDPGIRTLDFAPSPRSVNKFKRAPTSAAMKVPYKITYTVDNLPLADVIKTIRGEEDWPAKKYLKQSGN